MMPCLSYETRPWLQPTASSTRDLQKVHSSTCTHCDFLYSFRLLKLAKAHIYVMAEAAAIHTQGILLPGPSTGFAGIELIFD